MLTNRENRFASPRFANDFTDVTGTTGIPDGLSDDLNSDNIPDYWPTLYPGVFTPLNLNQNGWQLIFEVSPFPQNVCPTSGALMGFPWIFPGAYSQAADVADRHGPVGWIHSPAPVANVPQGNGTGTLVSFDSGGNGSASLAYLQSINHNPLDVGDNLPTPTNPATITNGTATTMNQTWWGFPTWRETLSPLWNDPTVQVNVGMNPATPNPQQPNGLVPLSTVEVNQGRCERESGRCCRR